MNTTTSAKKNIALYLQIALYILAGINHFWHPAFYIKLIPPYLPNAAVLNIAAGIFEIAFGLMLIFRRTRKLAAYGIVAMLIVFILSHIYSIQINRCDYSGACKMFWIALIRLVLFQPLLIALAWMVRK